MNTETATVRPQKFYEADVYAEDLDYTVVDHATPLDSLESVVVAAARAVWTSVAGMAVVGCLTIGPGEMLLSAHTGPQPSQVAAADDAQARARAMHALSERLHARARLVSAAFTRVPLSAAERVEDPDYGF